MGMELPGLVSRVYLLLYLKYVDDINNNKYTYMLRTHRKRERGGGGL